MYKLPSSYRISRPWGCNVQPGDYSEYCIVYLKVAKRVGLRSSPHKKKKIVTTCGDGS